MWVIMFLMSLAIGAVGLFLLLTAPLQGMIGGVVLIIATVLFAGAAIVEAVNHVERELRKRGGS